MKKEVLNKNLKQKYYKDDSIPNESIYRGGPISPEVKELKSNKHKTEDFLRNELLKARSGVDNFNTIINK